MERAGPGRPYNRSQGLPPWFCAQLFVFRPLQLCASRSSNTAYNSVPQDARVAPNAIVANVTEVIVPVTVTDDKGRFVRNLDQKDFQIFDQGKEQVIKSFSRERNQPMVVGFLLDLSNGSRSRVEERGRKRPARKKWWKGSARRHPARESRSRFGGYLIGYSNRSGVDGRHHLQRRADSSTEAPANWQARRRDRHSSTLHSTPPAPSRKLIKGEPVEPRRIIIVIGDGNDNASKHSLAEVLELAQRNLVTIYGLSTVSSGFANEGDANLVKLAEATGGKVEYPLNNPYKDVAGFLSQPRDEGNYAITTRAPDG